MRGKPVVFVTDASPQSLATIPGLAALVAALGSSWSVVHVTSSGGPNGKAVLLNEALQAVRGQVAEPTVAVLPLSEAEDYVHRVADDGGAIVAIRPERLGAALRFVVGNRYERWLKTGVMVLALPADGRFSAVRRVLFPADLSPQSLVGLDAAIALCQATGAELRILHVFGSDKVPISAEELALRQSAKSPSDLYRIDQGKMLALVDRATAAGVNTVLETAEGRAHAKILDHIYATGANLVVMATHGSAGAEDLFLGSTTVRVIRDSPAPVLAIRC